MRNFISTTIDQIFDPDVRIGTPLPIEATGAQALKRVWATLLRAYPDLHVTVEDVFGEEDRLVARNTVTGTHLGEYLGVAPTGRFVTYNDHNRPLRRRPDRRDVGRRRSALADEAARRNSQLGPPTNCR